MKKIPSIRLTVGKKLIGLIAILLMTSVVSLVWLATRLFIQDNTSLIQQMNADSAAGLTTQMRELLENTTEKMRVLGTLLLQDSKNSFTKESLIREFFTKDKDFLAVYLHKYDSTAAIQTPAKAVSPYLKEMNDPDGEKLLSSLLSEKDFQLPQVFKGEVQVSSVKLFDGGAAIAIAVPFIQVADSFSHTLTAFVKQNKFVKAFTESDVVTNFMVDRKGKLLAHPDATRVAASENISHLGIVKQLLEGKFNNGQTRYVDSQSKEARLGAFRLVGFGGLGVVSEVAEAKAFEAARKVEYRATLLAVIILSISFMVGYFYSGTITWPINQLMDAARQITEGNFKIHLKPKGQDEIAHLSLTFNEMAKGLEERDRVKETFNKFHNKEIAEKLLSGEVKLGGEKRSATIFFSDIRGFTGMSEQLTPEEVVVMLNEYMTRMVAIIRAHGGIVDKYVGDAIMAIWGVPFEQPDDTYRAVKACLGMREDLSKLNELRLSRGQPVIKIGMGLNRGPVIAGNIGSTEKMEYTVIGDAVNLASRIESMTKEYGSDFLASSSVYEAVQPSFVWEHCKSTKVKGKSTAIEVFKVSGYVSDTGQPVIIETPYSSYQAEKSDKVVHDKEPAPTPAANPHGVLSDLRSTISPTQSVEQGWYFSVNSEVFGPFSNQEIEQGLKTQEISLNMLVSASPEGPWVELEKKIDLRSIVDDYRKAA